MSQKDFGIDTGSHPDPNVYARHAVLPYNLGVDVSLFKRESAYDFFILIWDGHYAGGAAAAKALIAAAHELDVIPGTVDCENSYGGSRAESWEKYSRGAAA